MIPESRLSPEVNLEVSFGRELVEELEDKGHEAYFAGGFSRDLFLGQVPKDIDIATSAKPEEVLALSLPGTELNYVQAAEAYPVVHAQKGRVVIEIASFRSDVYDELGKTRKSARRPDEMKTGATIFEDAQRRDFTINALYYNPITHEVLDPTERGIRDLEDKRLEFVGDPHTRILEDRVRVLRAVRFKNRLGFSYGKLSRQALVEEGDEVLKVSADRIRDELTKMLLHPSRAQALRDLEELGLLDKLLPEISACKGVAQDPRYHSEGDVFTHKLMVMGNLGGNVSRHLVWAALLHDIGKPLTSETDEEGRITFHGHAAAGSDLAEQVVSRLNFSSDDAREVVWLVANHMKVREIGNMKRSKRLRLTHPHFYSPSIKREDLFVDLLELLKADNVSSLRPDGSYDQESYEAARKVYEQIKNDLASQKPTIKEQYGIDGHVLMEHLGVDPKGAEVKNLSSLISHLNETYADEPSLGREDILAEAESFWRSLTNPPSL